MSQEQGLKLEEKLVASKGEWARELHAGLAEVKRLSEACQVCARARARADCARA
jgi:hypothetical protein